jgi:hypothetical protein
LEVLGSLIYVEDTVGGKLDVKDLIDRTEKWAAFKSSEHMVEAER